MTIEGMNENALARWVGLTDEERRKVLRGEFPPGMDEIDRLANAVLAAAGEKGMSYGNACELTMDILANCGGDADLATDAVLSGKIKICREATN
jgi:hypothetical protein